LQVKKTNSKSSENNNVTGVSTPAPTTAPQGFDPSSLPLIDPSANRLSLVGLDLSEPLTEAEVIFLESTIRDAFNKLHKIMGIDLIADSVAVGRDALFAAGNRITAGNLRGGNRKLERNIYGKSGPDIRPCTHHSGPLNGYGIEGCEWNIDFFLDCRCWMCSEDEDDKKDDIGLKEERGPQEPPQSNPEQREQSDQPSWYRPPPILNPEQRNRPTQPNPVDKKVFDQPSWYRPPPISNPEQRNRPTQSNPVDKEILKMLKESPFKRFHKLKKVGFGRGN
jgi:hypothetical protein